MRSNEDEPGLTELLQTKKVYQLFVVSTRLIDSHETTVWQLYVLLSTGMY